MSSLPLGGTTYTPATLVALVQSRIDAANQVATDKAAWQNAVKTYDALNTKVTVVVHDLKQLVIGAFGATSSKLADFGFSPKKVTVLTPAQKAAAAAKRAATRKARGTLGPKAKLGITGATVSTTAPATAATPGAPPVTPATAPPTAVPNTVPTGTPTAATPGAQSAAPAMAPTVTVNVTTAPAAASPVTTTTTATEPTQAGASPGSTTGSAPQTTAKS